MMAGMYGVYHGAEGIREIAEGIHSKAVYLSEMLQAYGYEQENTEFFDTLKISLQHSEISLQTLREKAEQLGINLYYDPQGWIGLSVDETVDIDDMNDLIELFAEASGNMPMYEESDEAFEGLWAIDESRVRDIDYMQAEVFKLYHTETELMRYLKRLDRKDISLATSMIPLGRYSRITTRPVYSPAAPDVGCSVQASNPVIAHNCSWSSSMMVSYPAT